MRTLEPLRWSRAAWLLLALVHAGCSSDSGNEQAENEPRPADPPTPVVAPPPPEPAPELYAEVLMATPNDSVLVEEHERERRLVWVKRASTTWSRIWYSSDLYSAEPHVQLADFDGDATTDLFWALHFEEIVGGAFELDKQTGVEHVLVPGYSCAAPTAELDANGYLIINLVPGVDPNCRDMGVAEVCVSEPARHWPSYFRFVDGALVEVFEARSSYAALSARFAREAERLDSLARIDATLEGTSARFSELCSPDFAARLRTLADSALRVGL